MLYVLYIWCLQLLIFATFLELMWRRLRMELGSSIGKVAKLSNSLLLISRAHSFPQAVEF